MVELRRVVTGQAKDGPASISTDGPVPTVFASKGGPSVFEIWKTFAMPASLNNVTEEPAAGDFVLQPPAGGSVFRLAVIPPDAELATADHNPVLAQLGEPASGNHSAQMHRTSSIDFAVVIDGPIVLMVDDGETELHTGDVVVQRGANHAWSNRSDKACRVAFVMIDASH